MDYSNQNMAAAMSSSSSEDEDEKQRLREAVFDVATCTVPANSSRRDKKGKRGALKRSLREVQNEDEEACSTGISGEVRDFVAKKLSSFLDSCITDLDSSHNNTEMTSAEEESNCGFRIFSTSDPDTQVNLTGVTPQVRRRRQVESSSSGDSDSEDEKARLAEAAVTHQAILQSSAPLQVANTSHSCSDSASTHEKVASSSTNTVSDSPSNQSVPKKKKKKKRKETSNLITEGTCRSVDNVDVSGQRPRKKKKSKQKSKDLRTEKLSLCQGEKGEENGCGEEEGMTAAHSVLLQKHHKKKKRKILDDS